jgi:hypothetical protein
MLWILLSPMQLSPVITVPAVKQFQGCCCGGSGKGGVGEIRRRKLSVICRGTYTSSLPVLLNDSTFLLSNKVGSFDSSIQLDTHNKAAVKYVFFLLLLLPRHILQPAEYDNDFAAAPPFKGCRRV